MKKSKIVLTAATFLLAVGGAFASTLVLPEPAYIKTGVGSVPLGQCEPVDQCQRQVANPCQFGAIDLFGIDETPNTCTVQLYKP